MEPINQVVTFNSESKERLHALLIRTAELLPFTSQQDCDTVFNSVADFCMSSAANKKERSTGKYQKLSIEELVALAPKRKLEKKRPRQEEEEEEEGEGKDKGEGDGVDDAKEAEDVSEKWLFQQAYNVVSVLVVEADPLSITLLARPPVAGNRKPLRRVMNEVDLDSVETRPGRNGTKLRHTLLNALSQYARTHVLPHSFVVRLRAFEWSKQLIAELDSSTKN